MKVWAVGGEGNHIIDFKVEKGNKATDWTPAPEDQVTDWNETDVNSFAFLKNKPTTLSGYSITELDVKTMAGLNSNTVAIGENINAAPYSVAIGSFSNSGSNSVALGSNANAGAFSVAIGTLATAGDGEGVLGDVNFTYKWRIPGTLTVGSGITGTLTGNASSATK